MTRTNEHTIKCRDCKAELDAPYRCEDCQIIATWYNEKTGEVFTWRSVAAHEAACEDMQDQLDAAFDHQYFEEW